ncbi:hypothetical protein CBS101457_000046 [Exobasidium rhododendri]|nr:hypothetical protein CBS101457_000046 [Exobasidium rhododendri]
MIWRRAVRVAARTSSPSKSRSLHLQANDAVAFLRKRLQAVEMTPSRSDSPTSVAFLLHADRRPQSLSSSSDPRDGAKVHFGPSLQLCPSSILDIDRSKFGLGDLGILKAQKDDPSNVVHLPIDLSSGLTLDHTHSILQQVSSTAKIHFSDSATEKTSQLLQELWHTFDKCEGIWFSGTLVVDGDDIKVAAPFLEFDDFAVHRVEALREEHLKAKSKRDANTAQAEDGGLFYIKLNNGGNVGSFGYGAGNAMATMDGLAMVGGMPTNFLDGGGGANVANAKLAIETLHRDPSVKSIFVNTFGGLTRCSLVAEGIIQAVKENDITTPTTIRVMGTEAEEAKELLRASGLPFTLEDDFKKAARSAVSQGTESR